MDNQEILEILKDENDLIFQFFQEETYLSLVDDNVEITEDLLFVALSDIIRDQLADIGLIAGDILSDKLSLIHANRLLNFMSIRDVLGLLKICPKVVSYFNAQYEDTTTEISEVIDYFCEVFHSNESFKIYQSFIAKGMNSNDKFDIHFKHILKLATNTEELIIDVEKSKVFIEALSDISNKISELKMSSSSVVILIVERWFSNFCSIKYFNIFSLLYSAETKATYDNFKLTTPGYKEYYDLLNIPIIDDIKTSINIISELDILKDK